MARAKSDTCDKLIRSTVNEPYTKLQKDELCMKESTLRRNEYICH